LLAPKALVNRYAVKLPEMNISKIRLLANNASVDLAPAWGWDAFGRAIEEPPPAPRRPGRRFQRRTSDARNRDASEEPGRPVPGGEAKLPRLSVFGAGRDQKGATAIPPQAKRVNAAGPVNVQITISETGRVIEAKATSGHPLLRTRL